MAPSTPVPTLTPLQLSVFCARSTSSPPCCIPENISVLLPQRTEKEKLPSSTLSGQQGSRDESSAPRLSPSKRTAALF